MNRSLTAALRELTLILGLGALVLAATLFLGGCSEPSIESPWSGRKVTASELAAERAKHDADAKAEQDAAAAELEADLAAANASAMAQLAAIKAKHEPRIRAAVDKVKIAETQFAAAVQRIEEIKQQRAAAAGLIPSVLNTIGIAMPGWKEAVTAIGAIFGVGATAYSVRAKVQASTANSKLEQAVGHLVNIVDAIDHANESTPAGPYDQTWDERFKGWSEGSQTIIKKISNRTDPAEKVAV